MHVPALQRFFRYAFVGVSTFLLDLAILWVLIDYFSAPLLLAAGLGFLIGISINYCVSRVWVFTGTEQTFTRGYVYFVLLALIGVLTTVLLMWAITSFTSLHYITVRVLIAGFIGTLTYFLNWYFNFRMSPRHSEAVRLRP
jgi:putative flippase GtrA